MLQNNLAVKYCQKSVFEKLSELVATFSQFDQVLIAYEESAKAGEQAKLAQSMASLKPGQKVLLLLDQKVVLHRKRLRYLNKQVQRLSGLDRVLCVLRQHRSTPCRPFQLTLIC